MKIPFNKPFVTGYETTYIAQAIQSDKLSGDGEFTAKCHRFLEQRFGFRKALLTTSCTDALEMTALLSGIADGDEVIMPSYTFVSTANAFALRGAKIVFADSGADGPNIDPAQIEALVTPKTRAVVVVHYAGVACDMDPIMALAEKHGFIVIEDAAHAIDSYHDGRPLGTLGTFGAFSFHDTKNIIAGEGGLLTINNERYAQPAEFMREKGTNRSAFVRGEIDKYEWVSLGSSFLPSEMTAAFLLAQLESLDRIQARRVSSWKAYFERLQGLESRFGVQLPTVPAYATINGHIFHLVMESNQQRNAVAASLKARGISATSHYLSLHASRYFASQHDGRALPNSDRYSGCLLRLPLFCEISADEIARVCEGVEAALSG